MCYRAYCHAYWGCKKADCLGCLCICINAAASFISSQVECVTEPIVMPTGAARMQTVLAVFVFVLMLRLLLFLHR